jgi:glucose-1-phosphate thymidylyltransferase
MYDVTVWDKIERCKPSLRGELEITDVNNLFLTNGTLTHYELKGFWSDAGTPDSLVNCSQWVKESR